MEYLDLVCSTINLWAQRSKERVNARVTVSRDAGLAIITLITKL